MRSEASTLGAWSWPSVGNIARDDDVPRLPLLLPDLGLGPLGEHVWSPRQAPTTATLMRTAPMGQQGLPRKCSDGGSHAFGSGSGVGLGADDHAVITPCAADMDCATSRRRPTRPRPPPPSQKPRSRALPLEPLAPSPVLRRTPRIGSCHGRHGAHVFSQM